MGLDNCISKLWKIDEYFRQQHPPVPPGYSRTVNDWYLTSGLSMQRHLHSQTCPVQKEGEPGLALYVNRRDVRHKPRPGSEWFQRES